MRRWPQLALLNVMLMALTSNPVNASPSCASDKRLVAPCFTVRGRLSSWNGAPTYRIWIIGTKRLLGVSEGKFAPDGYGLLPTEIPQPTDFDTAYFGDFTVCPFEPDNSQKMRLVCVAAVTQSRISEHRSGAVQRP